MNKVLIVIPVYKPGMTIQETASLQQVTKVLDNFPIVIVTFEGLDLRAYKEVIGDKKMHTVYFDRKWFESVWTYNKLLLSKKFYEKFVSSEYMLIYQLDAWVFKDNLQNWCKEGYDYIGAPWFEGMENPTGNKIIIGVGNGGFSLRKLETAMKIIRRVELMQFLLKLRSKPVFKYYAAFRILLKSLNFYLKLKSIDDIHIVMAALGMNEDCFWGTVAGNAFKDYNLAPVHSAIEFSFEVNPSYLYSLNNNHLPFGCHAWEKYEPDFWSMFIPTIENSAA